MSSKKTKKTPEPILGPGLVFVALLMLITLVAGALGAVLIRQEVAHLAAENRQHEREIARMEREIGVLRAQQARALLPDELRHQALLLGLRLVPPSEDALVRMPGILAFDGIVDAQASPWGPLARHDGAERRGRP